MADTKSSTLLNALRNGATQAYKDAIPEATAANLAEVGTAILAYESTRNEFMYQLVNKIGMSLIKDKEYKNPLKEFKRGMLPTGSTIEEIFVELVKAAEFDAEKAETELFKRNIPDVRSLFHTINRKDMYKTTTQNDDLKAAFVSENGVMDLVGKIISKLYTSDELDEYLIMKNAIMMYGVEGKFYPVTVTAVTNEATAKAAMAKIKEISNKMTFMSKTYNHAGVHNHTPKEDQIVLIDTAFDAMVDVEVLAAAFNMEKADFIGRRVLIDDFGGLTNVLCAIVDKAWFMDYDREISADQAWNAEGRYFNHFLHHWAVMSVSPFENAVLFQTTTPTVTSISVSPATATVSKTKATTLQLYAETTGTNNAPSKCTWSSDDTGVLVNSMGLVHIPANFGDATVTITATNTFDGTKTDTCVITVGAGA